MHRLSFCSITVIQDNIAEIIFDDQVDIDLDMVNEFWQFVDAEMKTPIHVIINKKHRYSYQFEALMAISESSKIQSVAVISYNEASASMSEYLNSTFNKSGKHVKIFSTQAAAIQWIKKITDQ